MRGSAREYDDVPECLVRKRVLPPASALPSGATRSHRDASLVHARHKGSAPVSTRRGVGLSAAIALLLAAASVGTSLGAIQVIELSAERVLPGTTVTLRVGMTARAAGTAAGTLFMIPSGTFGDSPESLRCEQVGGAVEVGQIRWTAGTVEYDGTSHTGVTGEVTFTVPELAADTYRLAESITSRGTGCHIFTSIDVVAELPDTALPLRGPDPGVGEALPAGAGLLAIAIVIARLRVRPLGQT